MEEASEKVSIEADDSASFVIHELEALQSIYVNEIEIKDDEKSTSVSIDLNPATADNREEQYVKMTLKFNLNKEYPNCIPEISIRNPRGLSDEKLSSIIQDLKVIAESKYGSSMLFEIIEAAKEHLTNENRPCGECAICLYGFSDDDVFTKTECYHYFHSHCLARYVKNASNFESTDDSSQDSSPNKEILCPMCRLTIEFNGSEDLYPPPTAKEDEFIIDEELLTFQKKMADIYQKQVEKGGIIDIEAEKNKYLLEISDVSTQGDTAENSVPDEANDVDATPETDSSTKPEGNASVMPKDRASGSKDMRISSGNEPRNKDVRYDGRAKNDRYGYNKQSRGNPNRNNSYRGNQRFNRYPKPHEQRFNRFKNRGGYSPERFDAEEHYTEGDLPQNKADSEDYSEACHDTSPVTDLSPRPRSYIPSNKRNERTNYYDSNRKYDGEKKGNFYHRSNSDTRGRRYGPNSYEKYNKNQNYQDARRQNYDSEVNNKTDCAQISNESLNEASESISPSDKECFQNNKPECDDKDESKRQDICAGNSSNGAYFDPQRRNAYRSDTRFQDGRRDSFKRGRQNRGYRNQYSERQHPSSYRENNYHYQGGKFAQENHSGRNYNRGSRGNSYRYSREENLHYSNDKRDYNRSDFSDPSMSNERNQFSERSREFSEKNEQIQRSNNHPHEGYSNKSSRELDGNYAENGYRHNGRNRSNSNYQNRSYNSRGNEDNKYNSDKSSYPDGRNTSRQNTPRKYNKYSDIRSNKGSEESGIEFQVNSKSENHVNEKSMPESTSEGAAVSKTDLNEESCEFPCDEANVPEEKLPVLDSKKVQPPPGFSNPLKKVVYGLQAANPPPGFPRS
ncbi:e3 ubiquitin-protein ligase RNF25 [Trichonephila inaurata madagascariensis]|uniref:E3 ubiquitin-protein ligase RNF25 n=1 Tax=Trichonephila inaurata madagascariensis TaxID=2747483 RepID=A0A8X6XCF0_9ARAC|nr:e3 ubiquitin-protein ligase RNF25 [Trichonephila inaurata madagascariensis]